MSGTEHGQVPFLGRKCYLIAFRDEGMYSKFVFPKADQIYAPLKALPQWHVKKDERYYIIPDWYKELLRCEKFETGKIYSVLSEYRGREKNKILKEYDSCPILTRRSWYRTFVMDENGVRRITPEEYMSMQGDKETEFPPQMSHSKIWEAINYAGIYGVEDKIAFNMGQILECNSLQENIAEYLLREFDDEKFLYRKQDADNRFSMRTLLKYADSERVEFSHRSIREYFVAVYLWNLLKDDNPDFKDELRKNYYSHETLSFLAELIQGEPSKSEKSLHKLIELMEQDTMQSNLSAKIMQILYFANEDRKIPKANWSKKNLADISIPGANLSDQNLRGAIFANANLNNVHLDGCDCSYCDMTGARLGESSKILTLRYVSGELMCLYEDGCMRGWDIQCIEENSCIADIPVMEHAVFGENKLLCVQNDMKIRMIRFQNDSWHVSQEYVKRNNRRLLSMSEELLLLKEEGEESAKLMLIHLSDGSVLKEWMVEKSGCGTIANGNLVVVYDGTNTIELFYVNDRKRYETFDVEKSGNVIALDAYLKDEAVYILLGYSDGVIWVYQYMDEMLRVKMKSKLYGLMHLAFCGTDIAAIADSEGGIHQALLDYNQRRIHMDWKATMKLSIYCKNIKTDGLIPESIRLRLLDRS